MVLFSLHLATTFVSRWAKRSGLHFLLGRDPPLQGKATAACPQLVRGKCCALLGGFWKGELLFGLVGWCFVGLYSGLFLVKFHIPSLPEGSGMEWAQLQGAHGAVTAECDGKGDQLGHIPTQGL